MPSFLFPPLVLLATTLVPLFLLRAPMTQAVNIHLVVKADDQPPPNDAVEAVAAAAANPAEPANRGRFTRGITCIDIAPIDCCTYTAEWPAVLRLGFEEVFFAGTAGAAQLSHGQVIWQKGPNDATNGCGSGVFGSDAEDDDDELLTAVMNDLVNVDFFKGQYSARASLSGPAYEGEKFSGARWIDIEDDAFIETSSDYDDDDDDSRWDESSTAESGRSNDLALAQQSEGGGDLDGDEAVVPSQPEPIPGPASPRQQPPPPPPPRQRFGRPGSPTASEESVTGRWRARPQRGDNEYRRSRRRRRTRRDGQGSGKSVGRRCGQQSPQQVILGDVVYSNTRTSNSSLYLDEHDREIDWHVWLHG
ncbi:MAG: hypothetical protein M1825_001331 [Sarcosagium campestre]|nr:MAG: hypothetical protein M1825_001331 [Sarcosagium campestre]